MITFDKRPIRILCVFGSLDRGGAESMCMNLFRHIDRELVTFDFVKHTSQEGAFENEIRSLGGNIYICPALTIKNFVRYIRWWNNHFQNHPEHQIIHGHMFTTSGIYFKIAHKYGRKTIGHSHCSKADGKVFKRNIIEQYIRAKLREMIQKNSDYRLACSTEAGKLIYSDNDFSVLHNAIDISLYSYKKEDRDSVRKEFEIENNDKLIIVIGKITAVKNPIGVISICKELSKINDHWKLLWCGTGDLEKMIKDQITMLGLQKHFIFAGVRNDVEKLLSGADVYIMPSLYEGLPLAAIEAQAAGLPCLLSDSISRETAITPLCRFLPLGQWSLWAETISKIEKVRSDTSSMIQTAGYDVRLSAKQMQDYYLAIASDIKMYNEDQIARL